jgi:hypothetical protein
MLTVSSLKTSMLNRGEKISENLCLDGQTSILLKFFAYNLSKFKTQYFSKGFQKQDARSDKFTSSHKIPRISNPSFKFLSV